MMYAVVVCIILIIVAIATRKIPERFYWIGVLLISAALIYSTTLLGSDVVGSDVHREIVISRDALNNGWNIADEENQSGSSFVLGALAPFLSRVFFMDITWVYKLVLPLFLIMVPVVLYYVFKAQFGAYRAFFAAVFFMIVPTFNMEIAQIAKSMVAELFLAIMILVITATRMRWYWKLLIIFICLVGTITSHYTIGLASMAFLLGIVIVRLFMKITPWFKNTRTHIAVLIIPLVLAMGAFGFYYSHAGGGVINQVVLAMYKNFVTDPLSQLLHTALPSPGDPQIYVKIGPRVPDTVFDTLPPGTTLVSGAGLVKLSDNPIIAYFQYQPRFVQMALGIDMIDASPWGKVFRVLQLLSQFIIIVGAFYLIYKRYNFSAEFIAGIGCSFVLLLLCIFVEQFSAILNMTRFYHLSLFFLAPCFVAGFDFLLRGKI